MSVQGVSTNPYADALSGGIRDFGDIALAVAILQMDTIDGEIVTRLREMQHMNEVRKAITDRIAQLNGLVQSIHGEDGWFDTDQVQRLDYRWDPEKGEVVPECLGLVSTTGWDQRYRVRMQDGSDLTWGEIMDRAAVDGEGTALDQALATLRPDLGEDPRALAERFITTYQPLAYHVAEAVGGEAISRVKVKKEALTAEIDRLRGAIDNVSADTEIGMLKLNRLLNHRNQALQMASNVMSASHQTAMGIINNLKV